MGAAEIAAGVGLAFVPGGQMFAASLIMSGISSEIGAISQALGHQGGMNVTTRQPAGLRQIVRGTQRVPGTIVYASTTGGTARQYNMVVVGATHSVDALQNMYLDGRRVVWQPGSHGQMAIGQVSNPATIGVTIASGVITQLARTAGGAGYFNGYTEVNPGLGAGTLYTARVRIIGDGTGARATATIQNGTCTGITLVSGGQDYTYAMVYVDGAYIFGGYADPGQYYGANGVAYTFGSDVFCVPHWGDETAATVNNVDLYNNDPTWAPTSEGTPYLGGCTWFYLKLEADSGTFPQFPEIRLTIRGKNDILDPRVSAPGPYRGYSDNWALNIADAITDPNWGLGDSSVNQAQLIAAANVCDELVVCNAPSMVNGVLSVGNSSEKRYTLHHHYNTGTGPGDVIQQMLEGAAGRLSRIGGEWYIWPAYWQGPSFTCNESLLVDDLQWSPKRSLSQLYNRVTGTYTAANYPYAVAGDLYDSNGYWEGQVQNNFPYSFQPTNFPMYAADVLHGYASDAYLAQDGGIQLPKELPTLPTLSIAQAQRVAKINLMRNRQQGQGKFPFGLAALQMQPTDTFSFSSATLGWTSKTLEVQGLKLRSNADHDGSLAYFVEMEVGETDQTVYEWGISEELNIYDVPVFPGWGNTGVVPPPTAISVTDDQSTALMLSSGSALPRLLVQWTPPNDSSVQQLGSIQCQYNYSTTGPTRPVGSPVPMTQNAGGNWQTSWLDGGTVSGAASLLYISGLSQWNAIVVQLRAVRPNGATSAWVQAAYSPSSLAASWTLGNGNAPTIEYPDGTTIQYWQPRQPGADVTGTNTSLQTSNLDNHTLDNLGDGASYARVLSTHVLGGLPAYGTGVTVDSLQPAQAGADVTGAHTSADTSAVSGTPSSTVKLATTAQQRNLIPDSDLKFLGTYWTLNAALPIVTGAGGDGGNGFRYTSTGAPSGYHFSPSGIIAVTPGVTYALSGYIDATCVDTGAPYFGVFDPTITTNYCAAVQSIATKGRVSAAFTCPAGVTQVKVICDTANCTTNYGPYLYFSNPQLEVGSVATAYKSNLLDDASGEWAHGAMSQGVKAGVQSNGNLVLKNIGLIPGVTAAPTLSTAAFADLPELGSGNAAMTFTTQGNPCLISVMLGMEAMTGSASSGPITGCGVTFSSSVSGSSHPTITVSISGNGSGASAVVTWSETITQIYNPSTRTYTQQYSWSPVLNITGGTGYSSATATVTITNASGSYVNGVNTYTCTIQTGTPVSGAEAQVQVLMDGGLVLGVLRAASDVSGSIPFTGTQMVFPPAGAHSFQVQSYNPNAANTVTSSIRSFQIVELG